MSNLNTNDTGEKRNRMNPDSLPRFRCGWREANDTGKERSQRRPLGCFARGLIALFIALLAFVAIAGVLPFILNWPTRYERQIMNEVKRLGGRASFPHMSPAGCYVDLRHLKVTDRDLALLDLGRSRILWVLYLSDTSVGDPGMKYRRKLAACGTSI